MQLLKLLCHHRQHLRDALVQTSRDLEGVGERVREGRYTEEDTREGDRREEKERMLRK